MTILGNFLNKNLRENYIKSRLKSGVVLRCLIRNINPPKEKRFVIIGESITGDKIGVVFINSNINWKVIKTIELAQLQLYVKAEDNNYLTRDSYIDCSRIREISKQYIIDQIIDKIQNVLGEVKTEDYSQIISFLKKSRLISPKLLRRYNIKK